MCCPDGTCARCVENRERQKQIDAMTDQPKPTRWERDEGGDDIYFWSKPGDANLIVISGPDREANAALFIRAQHMDELVEALEGMLSWAEKRPDKHPFDTWERARDVLAKIKGER